MADTTNSIFVHRLGDMEYRSHTRVIHVAESVNDICCVGSYVFLALGDGSVMKYAKEKSKCLMIHSFKSQYSFMARPKAQFCLYGCYLLSSVLKHINIEEPNERKRFAGTCTSTLNFAIYFLTYTPLSTMQISFDIHMFHAWMSSFSIILFTCEFLCLQSESLHLL